MRKTFCIQILLLIVLVSCKRKYPEPAKCSDNWPVGICLDTSQCWSGLAHARFGDTVYLDGGASYRYLNEYSNDSTSVWLVMPSPNSYAGPIPPGTFDTIYKWPSTPPKQRR
jgi:hypothetical protein